MKTVSIIKQKPLSDSEQTIVDIRRFRWEESKKITSYEDLQRYEKTVDEEMNALRLKFKKENQ